MKRIRVLLTIPQLVFGGAERQLLELARRLDRVRFEPTVAVLKPGGPLEAEAREAGVTVEAMMRRSRFDLSPVLKIAAWARRGRPAVIHSFLFLDGFYARLGGALAGAPRVASLRGEDYRRGSPHDYADRALQGLATRLVANSAWMRDQARARGLNRAPIAVIPNGVDTARFERLPSRAAARQAWGLPADAFVVGYIGRFSPEKDPAAFARVARLVAAQEPGARFLMAGDGPERASVEQAVREAGLADRFVFAGWVADSARVLAALDALALTSVTESAPNVVLEAMASGTPVVSTAVGGALEMVDHGAAGLLARPGDAEALAAAVLRLRRDPALADELRRAGRARVHAGYSMEAMTSRYEALYEELAGQA